MFNKIRRFLSRRKVNKIIEKTMAEIDDTFRRIPGETAECYRQRLRAKMHK